VSSPSGVWGKAKSNLVHFSFKIRHLVATILMIFPKLHQPNKRNHNQNREDFSFSHPWPWDYFLNGPNAAASSLIRHWLVSGRGVVSSDGELNILVKLKL